MEDVFLDKSAQIAAFQSSAFSDGNLLSGDDNDSCMDEVTDLQKRPNRVLPQAHPVEHPVPCDNARGYARNTIDLPAKALREVFTESLLFP
jgi:hypothetical protein